MKTTMLGPCTFSDSGQPLYYEVKQFLCNQYDQYDTNVKLYQEMIIANTCIVEGNYKNWLFRKSLSVLTFL